MRAGETHRPTSAISYREVLEVETTSEPRAVTRRGLLKGAAGAAGLAVVGGAALGTAHVLGKHKLRKLHSVAPPVGPGPAREFVSRPDLHPPVVTLSGGGGVDPGYLFLGPGAGAEQAGPLLLDERGEPVWFQPISRELWLSNFRATRYRGQPVLTWWEGKMTLQGYGRGEGVILDSSYRELARVRAANGRHIDVHEFLLTPQGTALFVCYPESVIADLSPYGGPTNAAIQQSIIQEVDVQSGQLLLEWKSLDHIPIEESYQPPANLYDYFHLNSIYVLPDGNLLISARCTWAVYKLDRQTGNVIWRLGGKRSDFELGEDAGFAWQHDARQPSASTITLFDDGDAEFDDGSGMSSPETQSRGVVLNVDEARRTAQLARSYRHPKPLVANAMGSFQTLPSGHVVIGWGSASVTSEFTPDGKLLADWTMGSKHSSYRAFRSPWVGRPAEPPAIAARRIPRHRNTTVYASWNGATEVSHWLVHSGPRPSELQPIGLAKRQGFETAIPLRTSSGYAAVTALDASGRKLATSRAVRL